MENIHTYRPITDDPLQFFYISVEYKYTMLHVICCPMCVFSSNSDGDYLQLQGVPPLSCSGRCGIGMDTTSARRSALELFGQMWYPYQFPYQFRQPSRGGDDLLWRRLPAWRALTLETAWYPCAVRFCRVCFFAAFLDSWSGCVLLIVSHCRPVTDDPLESFIYLCVVSLSSRERPVLFTTDGINCL